MIEFIPLGTAVVEVEAPQMIGLGPAGSRSIGALKSFRLAGERLSASLVTGTAADWAVRTGAIAVVDVRMTIKTDDGALIYVSYGGRLDLRDPAAGITAYVAPVFETGDERYAWLNAIQAVGKGVLVVDPDGARLEYEFYEVR
jgi:hypothetical protein